MSLSDELLRLVLDAESFRLSNLDNAGMMELIDSVTRPSGAIWAADLSQKRMKVWRERIAAARDKNDTYPWIAPSIACVAFDAVYMSCIGFWLSRGDAKKQGDVDPKLRTYAETSVRSFCYSIGSS